MDIEKIRNKIREGEYRLSKHVQKRCSEREIFTREVLEVILEGEIIEEHPDDKPFIP